MTVATLPPSAPPPPELPAPREREPFIMRFTPVIEEPKIVCEDLGPIEPVGIMDLKRHMCRHPVRFDHTLVGGHLFCGKRTTTFRGSEKSYCQDHYDNNVTRVAGTPFFRKSLKQLYLENTKVK